MIKTLRCSIAMGVGLLAAGGALAQANRFDAELRGRYEAREKDWRNGAIVYQVMVDRFAPPADLSAKKHLYQAPKVLRDWSETPKRGVYLPDAKLWSHEIEFWGGDLQSLRAKLPHVQSLGADVLYLNPIHLAYTNHKYDAFDYNAVSPEYGTRDDVKALARAVHAGGMKLVLDGVFNHMGRNAPIFKQAEADAKSPYRDWFHFGAQYESGARIWWLAANLPELNLENPQVQRHVWNSKDSVVRSFLRDGADGWRLDVAIDIGFDHLQSITRAAHAEKPGSLVVGEIANYPKEWFPAVDGVMNFTLREIVLRLVSSQLSNTLAQRMVDRMVSETGTENLLRSWLMLDNHDTPRLASAVPDDGARRLAQLLQFTLPASPNLYYGSELGMSGSDDPEMRAPMRWDLVREDNASLRWTRQLIALRKQFRALRIGDYRPIESEKLFAFERHTDRASDTVLVFANPGSDEVRETVLVANSKLMNTMRMLDPLGLAQPLKMNASLLHVTVPAKGFLVLVPEIEPAGGYSSYKRVQ